MPSKYISAEPKHESQAPAQQPEDVGFGWKAAGLLTRLLAGGASGVVGAIPSPITTPAAAAIGGGGEALAEKLEQPKGTPLSPARIATEAGLSAIPMGAIFKEGKTLANVARGAALAEFGNVARRKASTGSYLPHDKTEALWDAGSVGLGGLTGLIPVRGPKPDKVDELVGQVTSKAPATTKPNLVKKGATGDGGLLTLNGPKGSVIKYREESVRPTPKFETPSVVPNPTENANGVSASGIVPESPKAREARTNAVAASIQKDNPVSDLYKSTQQANAISAGERKLNETVRKAENKLANQEQNADLQQIRESQGGTSVSKIEQAKAKAQATAQKLNQNEAADDVNIEMQRQADLDKDLYNATKASAQSAKAQETVQAAAKKAADAEEAKRLTEAAKAGLKPQEPTVVERVTSTEGPVKTTKVTRFAPEEAEEGGKKAPEPEPDPAENYSVNKVPPREVVASTIYTSKKLALQHARFYGADDTTRIPGGYRVVFNDIEPPPAPEPPTTPVRPEPNGGGPKNGPTPNGEALPNGNKLDAAASRIYTNKKEAETVAKISGGRVKQLGPRKYGIELSEDMVKAQEQAETDRLSNIDASAQTPTPTAQPYRPATPLPKETTTATPVVGSEFDKGSLTPEEFRRYMELRPGMGKKTTPEQLAEFRTLHAKKSGQAVPAEVAPTTEPEMSVEDFAKAQAEAAAKNPVAEVPFSLTSGKAPKGPGPVEQSLIDEQPPVSGLKVAGESPKPGQGESDADAFHGLWGDLVDSGVHPKTQEEADKAFAELYSKPRNTTEEAPKPSTSWGDVPDDEEAMRRLQSMYPGEDFSKPPVWEQPDVPTADPAVENAMNALKAAKSRKGASKALEGLTYEQLESLWQRKNDGELAGLTHSQKALDEAVIKNSPVTGSNKPTVTETPTSTPSPELTSDDLAKLPPEQQESELKKIIDQMKGNKGAAGIMPMVHLAGGAVGAGVGAASNPDDPLTGAVLGGLAGAAAPSLIRAAIGKLNSTPNPDPTSVREVGEKAMETAKTFFRMLPDWQRFALLTDQINLPINMWVGPWGSAVMASIEARLGGDERGTEALKLLLDPRKFPKEWWRARSEAGSLIANAEERTEGQLGKAGPEWFQKITSLPGKGMTAGDVAIRNLLQEAGFRPDEARKITLTSDPYTPWGRAIANFKKSKSEITGKQSWLVNMLLPFYRTNVNQLEQGLERIPVAGSFFEHNWKGVPLTWNRQQLVKQGMGGGSFAGSFLIGLMTPAPDPNDPTSKTVSRSVRKLLNDFGGQYGAINSTGFMLGQAMQSGKNPILATAQNVLDRDVPMPSVEPLKNAGADIYNILSGNVDKAINKDTGLPKLPFELMPGMAKPDRPGSIPSLIGMFAGDDQKPAGKPGPVRRSRYVPPKPKKSGK